jgi:antitoxin MazE
LPKPLIEQAGLPDEVELHVQDGAIIIARTTVLRSGWADAAKEMRRHGDDEITDPMTLTRFDEEEWEW